MKNKMRIKIISLIGLIASSLFIIVESCLPGNISSMHSRAIFNLFSTSKTINYILPESMNDIDCDGASYVNRTTKLKTSFNPENTTDTRVLWSVDNVDDAEINQNGYFRPFKEGNYIVRATSSANHELSKEIMVSVQAVEVEQISLSLQEEKELLINATRGIITEITPKDATYSQCEYFSLNPNIADVDETGRIRGISQGITEIFAKNIYSGVESNSITVVVSSQISKPVTTITVDKERKIFVGEKSIITPFFNNDADDQTFHFAEYDPEFIEIEDLGIVGKKVVEKTSIKIVANSNPEICEMLEIEVVPVLAKGIELTLPSSIEIGKPEELFCTLIPQISGLQVTDSHLLWEISDPSKATIDEYGRILAVKTGQISIKVSWKEDTNINNTKVTSLTAINRSKFEQIIVIIRKLLGHFLLFSVAGIFAFTYIFSVMKKRRKHNLLQFGTIFGYGLALATLSEVLQIFALERSASIKDVGIDFLGFVVGVCFAVFIKIMLSKRKKSKNSQFIN